MAICNYEKNTNAYITVSRCGFIINPKWPGLGCSPDGLVSEARATKVKCPFSKHN